MQINLLMSKREYCISFYCSFNPMHYNSIKYVVTWMQIVHKRNIFWFLATKNWMARFWGNVVHSLRFKFFKTTKTKQSPREAILLLRMLWHSPQPRLKISLSSSPQSISAPWQDFARKLCSHVGRQPPSTILPHSTSALYRDSPQDFLYFLHFLYFLYFLCHSLFFWSSSISPDLPYPHQKARLKKCPFFAPCIIVA